MKKQLSTKSTFKNLEEMIEYVNALENKIIEFEGKIKTKKIERLTQKMNMQQERIQTLEESIKHKDEIIKQYKESKSSKNVIIAGIILSSFTAIITYFIAFLPKPGA